MAVISQLLVCGCNEKRLQSRVTLRFQVAASPSLTDEQMARITERLGNRISRDGWLQVSSQASRSQVKSKRTRRFPSDE